MKKLTKILALSVCAISTASLFAACNADSGLSADVKKRTPVEAAVTADGGTEEKKDVYYTDDAVVYKEYKYEYDLTPDDKPYTFENPAKPLPEMDEGMKMDGVFDEELWQKARWLTGVDRLAQDQWCDIRFVSTSTAKGMYFAVDVTEHGNRIWVNHNRSRFINSCIEMYFAPADDPDGSQRIFEFDFLADGTYDANLNFNGFQPAITYSERMPIIGGKTKGGEVNTPECEGYTVEAFFPYSYLEFCGYDVSDWENMEYGINPVHIWSFSENGTDLNEDRKWSDWAGGVGFGGWLTPSKWFKFNKDGIIANKLDIQVKHNNDAKGNVVTSSGLDYAFAGNQVTLQVTPIGKTQITVFKVNGEDLLDILLNNKIGTAYNYTFTPDSDVLIEVEFSK